MVVRWVYVATLVVVTFTVTQCEQIISNQNVNSAKAEDLCPCLPVDICPRVFGAQPDDAKYFGDIKKCDDDNHVRCCGASASFVVGKGSSTTTNTLPPILTTTQVPNTDILSRLNPDDDLENEISNSENDSVIIKDEQTEAPEYSETANIDNFQQRKFMNEEIDEEPAESESISETTNAQLIHEQQSMHEFYTPDIERSTEAEPEAETVELSPTTESQPISHRQPKNLDNIMMVYPNFPKVMSGIPKTTPKNMPETNEMKMFDEEVGMDLHLVFSMTTLEPETTTEHMEELDNEPIISTTKQPHFRFAKRRKQYRPVQRLTTESPADDMKSIPTTVKSRTTTRPTRKVRKFNKRPSSQELTNSTTQSPQVKIAARTPTLQEEEEEILHTSEDDKTQTNRFRLFSSRHRLNYLRRSTTTTTETPLEMSTRHNSQSKTLENRRTSKLNESSPKVTKDVRPSKMNETLILRMDTDHRKMISKVRVALKAATTENQIVEIPRSFASAEMNSRVKKIEKMLVNKMVNAFTEMQMKRRGSRPKIAAEPTVVVQKHKQISTTEASTTNPISNTTRPYRGRKKFELIDLLDKSVTVAMPNEVRRMRIRSTTTVKPTVITETTTRVQRRRPTTTIQPLVQKFDENGTSRQESTTPVNNQGRQYRRRTFIRRKYAVEPTLTTTNIPPVRTTSETITTEEFTTNPTTSTTTTTSPVTSTPTPITTQSTQSIEVVEESEDTSTENVEIDVTTSPHNIDSDVSTEFKPSPLWSIRSNEPTDFVELENLSHQTDGIANEQSSRRSRNAFEPPSQYMNGFIPYLPMNMNPFDNGIKIIGPIPKSIKLSENKRAKYNLQKDKVNTH